MSYVAKKSHVFDTCDGVLVIRQEPAGRLRTYGPPSDARSWSTSREDRRQYILELISRDYLEPTYWGTCIPIPDLFEIAMYDLGVESDDLTQDIDMDIDEANIASDETVTGESTTGSAPKIEVTLEPPSARKSKFRIDEQTGIPLSARKSKQKVDETLSARKSRLRMDESGGILAARKSRQRLDEDECTLLLSTAVKELETIKSIVVTNNKDLESLQKASEVDMLRLRSSPRTSLSRANVRSSANLRSSTNVRSSTNLRSTSQYALGSDLRPLRQRLINLKNLPMLVRALRSKLDAYEKQSHGVKKTPKELEQENQNLLDQSKKLEKDLENLKQKAQNAERLQLELNCLKDRLIDFSRLQREYDDLRRRTYDYDDLKADMFYFKDRFEKLKRLPDELEEMQKRLINVDLLEEERDALLEELHCYECCDASQKEEIEKMRNYIARLEDIMNRKQEETQTEVSSIREEMEKKDQLLTQSQIELQKYQDELNNTINKLNCEVSALRNQLNKYENKLKRKKEEISSLREKLEKYEDIKSALEEKVDMPAGDQHYQSVMKQTQQILKCLIRRLRQEED